jgi:hypothetical protein
VRHADEERFLDARRRPLRHRFAEPGDRAIPVAGGEGRERFCVRYASAPQRVDRRQVTQEPVARGASPSMTTADHAESSATDIAAA